MALIGNANAKISYLRRQKAISHINKALMPIVEDGANFQISAPALFGTEFAKESTDLVHRVKAIRVPLTSRREQKPFFRGGFNQKYGRGGGPQLYSRGFQDRQFFHKKTFQGQASRPAQSGNKS